MRLLVVEDEPKIAAYLKRGLQEQGYAVDSALNGAEALDFAEAAPYDLIVLDVLLPELSGLAVCRELRRRGQLTPVLMLTARDSIDDRVAGLDAGADDYLVKPFALRELLARVRALTRRSSEGSKSPALELADLSLDPRTRQVRRGGRPIELTAKEYAVLECLLRDPGRVLSRTVIAEHVWNYDADIQSNIIDVYIRNLRRKVDDASDLKLIHTVRGAGYRLSAADEAL